MRAGVIIAIAGALSLAGCSTGGGPVAPVGSPIGPGVRLAYTPPEQAPAPAEAVLVYDGRPDEVLQRVTARLQQPPFVLEKVDEQAGVAIARFSGGAESHLDCGWITAPDPAGGGAERVAGAREAAAFPRAVNQRNYLAQRRLQLDGRVVVSVQPRSPGTLAATEVVYVVTKAVDTVDRTGEAHGSVRETVSFRSGGSGRFRIGTQCQPNGTIERMVLAGLGGEQVAQAPPSASAAAAGAPAPVTGAVAAATAEASRSSSAGAALAMPPPTVGGAAAAAGGGFPFCDETRVAAVGSARGIAPGPREGSPGREGASTEAALCELAEMARVQPARGLGIVPLGGGGGMVEGEEVVLAIDGVPDRSFLYVSYVQSDGTVIHLAPQWLERGGERLVYETGFWVTPPYGRELIIALASPEPLFPGLRPSEQPAADYAAALRRELARLGHQIAASHAFVDTRPR
ncbi:MAG TPA: hypothetical protein VFG47_11545 [Geminicoccaceae bacterium]|nr:hypothetical protein [Geminicoccaceae bacterium]